METPHGTLTSKRVFDPGSHAWHPIEFPVRARADIGVMTWAVEHMRISLDERKLERSRHIHRKTGQSGATLESVETSALMRFVEHIAGVEQAHYFLADFEDDVLSLFEAVHHTNIRRIELLVEHSPADLLMMSENTSTTLVSPDQYRRYCARHIGEYASLIRDAGRVLVLHMCGHLRALLPQLQTVGAHAFEAFTTPPVGNTPLSVGREACPNTCLIGGTNAALWLQPVDSIIAQLERDLEALPHLRGIIPSSAGVMPPAARPETIRAVCDWIHGFSFGKVA